MKEFIYISQIEAQLLTKKSRSTIKNLVKKIKEHEQNGTLREFYIGVMGYLDNHIETPSIITYFKNGNKSDKLGISKDFVLRYFERSSEKNKRVETPYNPIQLPPYTHMHESGDAYKDMLIKKLEEVIKDKTAQIEDLIKTKDELLKQSEQSNYILAQQGQKIIELTAPKKKKWFSF